MPTERLSMRHIREVLRLHHSVGMSQRAVARSLNLAQGTVSKYLNRTRRAGLTWPLPPELDDDVRRCRPECGWNLRDAISGIEGI
jgi:transposase